MNKMMAATISAGATTRATKGTALPPKRALTIPPPTATRTRKKVPKDLGEQAPPLVAVVPEVELLGDRVRLPYRPQGHLGTMDRPLPVLPLRQS